MNDSKEERDASKEFILKSSYIIFLVIGIIICSAAILIGTIYLFSNPGLTSGLIFSAILVFFLIVPVILLLIFYFKKVKKISFKENEEEDSIMEKPKRVILIEERLK
ncbi:MAG TPA: hypothetical protein VMZ29_05050 [Candidatus Bathyarchaeia archaeon]|nr:hypothetical protein [Candidatus Bathyarchaeia archaeon]